jgi:hypothetical protein
MRAYAATSAQRAAFKDALVVLSRRIDLMLALPFEKLERLALEIRGREIAQAGVATAIPHEPATSNRERL